MLTNKAPLWIALLLSILTILCSAFAPLPIIAEIVLFSILCLIFPSPILCLVPVFSFIFSFSINYFAVRNIASALTAGANAMFFLLPSVLIAVSFLRKYSKSITVFNGAIGIYIYGFFLVVLGFILSYGKFTPQLLNDAIENSFSASLQSMLQQATLLLPDNQLLEERIPFIEQSFYAIKPLLPASLFSITFIISYLSVIIINAVLKRIGLIKNISYRIIPRWQTGAVFLIFSILSSIAPVSSFFWVMASSVKIILLPLFQIVGVGVIYDTLKRFFNKGIFSKILPVISLLFLIVIFYSFFYLIGCIYCIVNGSKSFINNSKGENQ
ncbi:MAG: DUF2232 domain-containing protein [Clostridia bacterium]|nr:DUF2232 domain-containing protein [Clostridia bacterium]